MASKMTSLAAIGAGAYGASVAFSMATQQTPGEVRKPAPQSLRGSRAPPANGLPSAALAASGVFVAAGAAQASKRANKRGVQA
eukprot:CAMPEP_0197653448 /NCGR_PEP_ID=MMETSP1338-20131121/35560_1 /TAXON_ID=43686 ORGANISM="Pelagodinium beii, Strain RCC1491" /NCGR_SAMPLE_ID=MMETSP1338 /ASSEMBLY_ACC=CAM_ASM_000754 /LENGTH=82 /DNA_ID=CAMNT_0043228563 /DNA_START=50 /DNA_END=295 /DNA_ORIENTATION=+